LVEAGILTGPEVQAAVEDAILPLLQAGADTLVLGCTHYPFLAPAIRQVAGPAVQLIDTGAAVARRVRQQLEHYQLLTTTPEGNCQLFSTDQNGGIDHADGKSPTWSPIFLSMTRVNIDATPLPVAKLRLSMLRPPSDSFRYYYATARF
jgi:glutamate racemase